MNAHAGHVFSFLGIGYGQSFENYHIQTIKEEQTFLIMVCKLNLPNVFSIVVIVFLITNYRLIKKE